MESKTKASTDLFHKENLLKTKISLELAPYICNTVVGKILDLLHFGYMFGEGYFYSNKPTALFFDPFMKEEIDWDKRYFPKSKMVYVEFDDYDEFHQKRIYRSVFKKLRKLGKTWEDLNYATGIDCGYNDDYDSEYDSDVSDYEDTEYIFDPTITFGKKRLRNLKKDDYKTNVILFGFSIDFKDYEVNRYGRGLKEDPITYCHNAKTTNNTPIFWCGIPYSEGGMAVGNFCTHMVYSPVTKYFGVDGDCG